MDEPTTARLTKGLYDLALYCRMRTPKEVRNADSSVELEETPLPTMAHSLSHTPSKPATWLGWGDEGPENIVILTMESQIHKPVFICRWLVEQPHNPNHHYIVYSVETELEVFICGGMTDYSGGGASNYETLHWVMTVISHITGCLYIAHNLDKSWDTKLRDYISQQYEARRKEENRDAQQI